MRQQLLSMVDLTTLRGDESHTDISRLCTLAHNDLGCVAAVCVYPEWVALAKALLQPYTIAVATVVNFPIATLSLGQVLVDTQCALSAGADEIDVVLPYHLLHDSALIGDFLAAMRQTAQGASLKVIIESGVLSDTQIRAASALVCASGADFIKTSTGKAASGASLHAVQLIADVVKQQQSDIGIKVSGGVRTCADAMAYYQLLATTLGEAFCQPATLRFGASQLVNDLLQEFE